MLPFTPDEFFDVFTQYNLAFPLAWIVLPVLAVAIVLASPAVGRASGRLVGSALAFLWLWAGMAYHILFFSAINPIAFVFGAFFLLEALLFLLAAYSDGLGTVRIQFDVRSLAGFALIAYACVLYPLLNSLLGHSFPRTPTFGLPCPLTVFTFGVLLLTTRTPFWISVIPLAWVLIGTSAAWLLGVWSDLMLPVAAIAFIGLSVMRKRMV
jgi:hypothetical protein